MPTDLPNSMAPPQMISTPSAPSVQPSMPGIVSGDSQSSGWAVPAQAANKGGESQVSGNLTWTTAPQGDASMCWGMMGQSNMNIPWLASVQGASGYNVGVEPNAVPNMGRLPVSGNTSMNMTWAATQGQGTPNAAAMMGGQVQGFAMVPWGGVAAGNANSYLGWVAQLMGHMNQYVGWSGRVQGNLGQANNDMNWNAPNGNPDWNNQQRDNGGRHSGLRGPSAGDSGRRSWKPRSGRVGPKGQRAQGLCFTYRDYGSCSRVDCKYFHPSNTDGYPSRKDQHFNRKHSGGVAAGDLTFVSAQQLPLIAPTSFASPALPAALAPPFLAPTNLAPRFPAPTDLVPPSPALPTDLAPPSVPCDRSTPEQNLTHFSTNPFALDGQETSSAHNEPTQAQSAPSSQDSRQGEGGAGKKRKQSQIGSDLEDVEFKNDHTNKDLQALDENRRREEQFSIDKCLDELDGTDGLTDEYKSYAMEVFESELNREMFIKSKNHNARLIWLKRKIRVLSGSI